MTTTQTNIQTETENIEQVTKLRKMWQWAMALQQSLEDCLEKYWYTPFQARLVGISDRMQYFWEFEDFYVSQKPLFSSSETPGLPLQLRLHHQFCDHFFKSALGPYADSRPFKLSALTPFEVFTLEKLSIQLFSVIQNALGKISSPQTTPFALNQHDKTAHLLWYIRRETGDTFPLVISIPFAILEQAITTIDIPEPIVSEQFADEQFLLNCYAADLQFRIGSTRASLTEMQSLALGDIVVLENSHLNQWLLWHDKRQAWVNIPIAEPKGKNKAIPKYKPLNPILSGDQGTMKTQTPQSFHWENLQVDLVASFEPLKFPIKRLKEISEGLVLEVSGLTENSININVDGQPVAWGELVIVGDKFAVRVQGVYEQSPSLNPSNTQDAMHYATHPQQLEASHQPTQDAVPEKQEAPTSAPPDEKNRAETNFLQDLNLDESDFDDLDENDHGL